MSNKQDNTSCMHIINIAGFPPPVGGIGSYLKRLKAYTDKEKDSYKYEYIDVTGVDIENKRRRGIICLKKWQVPFFLLNHKRACVVFHSNSAAHLLINRVLRKKHIFVYLIHGESILKKKNHYGWRHRVLSNAGYLVSPTEDLTKQVKSIFPEKKEIINIPFILFPKDVQKLTDTRLIELRNNTDFLFSGYAYSLREYNGNDLYGVDMMIECIKSLNEKGINAGIVILISSIDDQEKMDRYLTMISEYGLKDKILIINEVIDEASRLFVSTDAYMRPTNTDGDSFSIWEALYLGIPVLTSDATQRPEGCVLFKTRNASDLADKATDLISDYRKIKEAVSNLQIEGSEKRIIQFLSQIE